MILPWLLAALISSNTIDAASTHAAIVAGSAREGNPILPQQPWAIDAVIAGSTAYEVVAVRRLWHDGHHRKAILLTVAVAGMHSTAAAWNGRKR